MSPRNWRRWALAIVLLNIPLVALYVWSLDDTIEVSIGVQGKTLAAFVQGKGVIASDPTYSEGKVALYLADQHSLRAYSEPAMVFGWASEATQAIGDAVLASNVPSGWSRISIFDPTTAKNLSSYNFAQGGVQDWGNEWGGWTTVLGAYRPQKEGFSSIGSLRWQDYAITAGLARGKEKAGILVRSASPGSGYLFWLRPEHEDMGWDLMENGYKVRTLASGGFRLSLVSALKGVLREALWPYFYAVAILAALVALSLLVARGVRRWAGVLRPLADTSFLGKRPAAALVAVMAVSAAGAGALVATYLLKRIPHVQDSVAYLFQAKTFALGRLWVPTPPLPEFFNHEFIVNHSGMWFSKYPPGHPLILALGVLAGAPWLVSPILAGLSLVVIFLLGRELYGRGMGLLACLLLLFSPFFLFMSGSFMAHPTAMLFLSLFLLAVVKVTRGASWRWGLVGGLAWGLVFLTRELTAVAVALPLASYAIVDLARHRKERLIPYLVMGASAGVLVLLLLIYNGALTGKPFLTPFELWDSSDRLGFGDDVGWRGSHTVAEGLVNTRANLGSLLMHLFGWPSYITLALLFLPFVTLRARKWDWLLLAAAVSVVGAYVAYWADGIMFGPRYYYETLPMLVLLTARGFWALVDVVKALPSWRVFSSWASPGAYAFAGTFLGATLLLALVGYNIIGYMPGQVGIYYDYNYVGDIRLRTVERAGLHNALVFVDHEPTWEWWRYGSVFSSNSPLLNTDIVYARDLGEEKNRRLMALYPGRSYYRLDIDNLQPLAALPGVKQGGDSEGKTQIP